MMTDRSRGSIAARFPKESRRVSYLAGLATVLLTAGIFAPLITLEKLLIVRNTFSIASGVVGLLKDGQVFLFLVVGGFSIAFPIVKLAVLLRMLHVDLERGTRLRKYVRWMHAYGRWSMLDVFVVAILVVSVKLGALARVQMHYGLYLFAAAVVLTMFATARVLSLADRLRSKETEGPLTSA